MRDPSREDWKRSIRQHTAGPLPDDVVAELADHIADVYAAERAAGRSAADARDAAMALLAGGAYTELSSRGRVRSPHRSELLDRATPNPGSVWRDIGFDLRYALRTMRRQRAFTLAVVSILALGIGATTAAYAVIDTVLLRALPYPDSDRLIVLKHVTPKEEGRAFAAADWLDYAERNRSAVALAAYASWPMNITGGEPERLRSVIVSGNFFEVIGTRPQLGRVLTAADDTPSARPVVVLSSGFWRRRFGASPSAIGTSIVLNGRPVTVVGVMPSDFAMPGRDVDLWMPMGLSSDVLADRASEWLSVVGRLRPGIRLQRARADISVTAIELANRFPRTNANERALMRPLLDELVGGVTRPLWLGALAALFVLLAGCANAANLMLARATFRRDEIAIRAALGADAFRLARQLLVESSVLALAGGLAGATIASMFLPVFASLGDGHVPRIDALHLNVTSVIAAVVISVAAALLFGGVAAWLLVRGWSRAPGRSEIQRVTGHTRAGGLFLAGQVAFATVLIAGATFVVRGYATMLRIDPGFDVSNTLTLQLTLPRGQYRDVAERVRFADRATAEIATLPAVSGAGVVSDLPFVGNAMHFPVAGDDPQSLSSGESPLFTVRLADAGFFRTLGMRVRNGRTFDETDGERGSPVAVLNESAAARFGLIAAVGRHLRIADEAPRTIVGVVGDIRHAGLGAEEGPVVYVPFAQTTFTFVNWMGIVARGEGGLPSASAVRSAIARVDPNQPVTAVQSFEDYLDRETAPFRFSSLVIGSLAAAAHVLALTGIYGLTSFVVGRRSRELSVRIALGASASSIVRLVVKPIAAAVAAGSILGLAGGIGVNAMVAAANGGRADAVAIVTGCVLVAMTSAVAVLRPALRAAHTDPRAALQAQ
jgi:putative ABC transport system permease protein